MASVLAAAKATRAAPTAADNFNVFMISPSL
jgi:hypothetical protein